MAAKIATITRIAGTSLRTAVAVSFVLRDDVP
jgi:hypothetical protein